MSKTDKAEEIIDWNLATWEGSRHETLRRWAQLPLEHIITALEEMQELNTALHGSRPHNTVQEHSTDYQQKGTDDNLLTTEKIGGSGIEKNKNK